jgi:hypothetical protein
MNDDIYEFFIIVYETCERYTLLESFVLCWLRRRREFGVGAFNP